jgi:PTS system N-acetylglucosamine-specific IIC component
MNGVMNSLQSLGRALMLPIAVLPIAGLLLRLGQPDLLNLAAMAAAGDAIFSNLGLLFAIGVAVGLARENHGAAGLAAVVGFVVATKGAEVLVQVPADVLAKGALSVGAYKAKELSKLSVPMGIVSGLLSGWLYNRYSDIKLPAYLAFFGGRRFVPIASGCAGLALAFVFGYGWPWLVSGMDVLSQAVIASKHFGLFIYGVLNRLLIVTGLHHIINNVAWFLVGDYNGVTGDLKRFFAGDPSAGVFMSGFFPVMMFGLPAACLAMYHTAMPERRKATGGLLFSMALTSFLTGVTEPVEFTFMFLAPALFAVHAVLTGAAMVTMALLNVHLGFSFSAGLFDYVLNFNKATHPWLLLPVGAAYFGIYYATFRWCILRFGLRTPGRDIEQTPAVTPVKTEAVGARGYVEALGGAQNLRSVDACTTRLRLVLADRAKVNEAALRQLGAMGMVKIGHDGLQVVVGPVADQLAGEIRGALNAHGGEASASAASETRSGKQSETARPELLAALGGSANVRSVEFRGGRLLADLADAARVDEDALRHLGVRAVARLSSGSVHLLCADPSTLVLSPAP